MIGYRMLIAGLVCTALTGCGPVSTFMFVGNVVNAAGVAVVEQQEKEKRREPSHEEMTHELLEVRAKGGDPAAQFELGLFYDQRGDSEAKRWVSCAANAGHAPAQIQMGHWYNEDRDNSEMWPHIRVRTDDREAYMWYSLAASNDEPMANMFRNEIERERMSPEDIADAERRQAEWKPTSCGGTALSRTWE